MFKIFMENNYQNLINLRHRIYDTILFYMLWKQKKILSTHNKMPSYHLNFYFTLIQELLIRNLAMILFYIISV